MSSAAVPLVERPGVARGARPERPDPRLPWAARVLRALVGRATVPRRAGRDEIARFAREVEAAGVGLDTLSEADFDAAVLELRGPLRRAGLDPSQLPRGFAVVREAARRTLGTPHYDVQLYGGRVLALGGLAELETGEGKTLTATLPAALAALAGIPVHVITANDYLVERDAAALAPLYGRLGLSTGRVLEAEPDRADRRTAYGRDVTYVTHQQVAFDYLRDRLALAGEADGLARRFAGGDEPDTVLRGLCFAVIDEADSVLVDDARTPLILSRPGAAPDEATVRAALFLARDLELGRDFRLDRRAGRAELLDAGRLRLEERAQGLEGMLASARSREAWVERALCAEHLFERDRHYLVHDDAVQVIDQPTGRRAADRSFEGGIHALLEAREGVPITAGRETAARISYQRFFRRYLRLAGMTGTAREVAREFWDTYGLRTVRVPTRLPSRRSQAPMRVLPDEAAKWEAVVARIAELHAERRPVLVGTCSVESSERLAERLERAGLPHCVLNARQDREEAGVIARAGEAGRITVATRMAGRGTDIRLGPGVEARGGLAVVATELGEALRIDRQLFGRAGRQGQPGSCEQIVSREDRILAHHLPVWFRSVVRGPEFVVIGFTKWARVAEEAKGAAARRRLLESERRLEDLLAFSGRGE